MAATPAGEALTREQRDKMCRSKRRFDREGKALSWVVECLRRGVFAAGRVYRCPVCSGYHVTSQVRARSG